MTDLYPFQTFLHACQCPAYDSDCRSVLVSGCPLVPKPSLDAMKGRNDNSVNRICAQKMKCEGGDGKCWHPHPAPGLLICGAGQTLTPSQF